MTFESLVMLDSKCGAEKCWRRVLIALAMLGSWKKNTSGDIAKMFLSSMQDEPSRMSAPNPSRGRDDAVSVTLSTNTIRSVSLVLYSSITETSAPSTLSPLPVSSAYSTAECSTAPWFSVDARNSYLKTLYKAVVQEVVKLNGDSIKVNSQSLNWSYRTDYSISGWKKTSRSQEERSFRTACSIGTFAMRSKRSSVLYRSIELPKPCDFLNRHWQVPKDSSATSVELMKGKCIHFWARHYKWPKQSASSLIDSYELQRRHKLLSYNKKPMPSSAFVSR